MFTYMLALSAHIDLDLNITADFSILKVVGLVGIFQVRFFQISVIAEKLWFSGRG